MARSRARRTRCWNTDELISRIIEVVPPDTVVALVSDHGFERTDRVVNVPAMLERLGVPAAVELEAGLLMTDDALVAEALKRARNTPELGVGREVPAEEIEKFLPERQAPLAAFEPAEHAMFGQDQKSRELTMTPREKGGHYFWPGRPDYRATFVLWGPGIAAGTTPEIPMTAIAARFAGVLVLPFGPEREFD